MITSHNTTSRPARILALGGSTRNGSSSEKALRVAAAIAEDQGAIVELITGRSLIFPLYQPESDDRCAEARAMIDAIRDADGLLIASPSYHGTVSGMIKNALDYIEDLRDDKRVYLDGIPVGCIAVAHGWQAAVSTLHNLRVAIHALRGWPSPLGAALNAQASLFDETGCIDKSARTQLTIIATQVLDFANAHVSGSR